MIFGSIISNIRNRGLQYKMKLLQYNFVLPVFKWSLGFISYHNHPHNVVAVTHYFDVCPNIYFIISNDKSRYRFMNVGF